jgi:hypothetical protein
MGRIHGSVLVVLVFALAGCTATPQPLPPPTPTSSNDATVVPTDWQPVDAGPREGAMGSTTVDGDGTPVAYVVAAGDTTDAIRARFDLYWSSLAREDGTRMPKYPTIYENEVLTFIEPLPVEQD